MRWILGLTIYRLLLPLLFIAAFPGWVVKMLKRGGFGTRLGERAAIYSTPPEDEPCGATHLHAVSVGEALLALKLIREWRVSDPDRRFLLATGTATGHAVGTAADIPGLRVTYAPLDFRWMARRYLDRFEPSRIVLIEGEVWPEMLILCEKRGIPVSLVNARLSPRSARRYRRFAAWVRPLFGKLDAIAVQEPGDIETWKNLGISAENIHHTGSLKFDPGSGARPTRRADFQTMIDAFGPGRTIVLAASTFPGEEAWIANAIREADSEALPVIVPRHAERRAEVKTELERAGFEVVLRSASSPPTSRAACLVIDTTGELIDWTAHADIVIIGKSFLSIGGQNPGEAVLAGKPVIIGPHMENFQPFATRLAETGGCLVASNPAELAAAIRTASDPAKAKALTRAATALLTPHDGATRRIIALL